MSRDNGQYVGAISKISHDRVVFRLERPYRFQRNENYYELSHVVLNERVVNTKPGELIVGARRMFEFSNLEFYANKYFDYLLGKGALRKVRADEVDKENLASDDDVLKFLEYTEDKSGSKIGKIFNTR